MGGRARGVVSRVSGAGEAGIFPSSMISRRSRLLEQAAWRSQGAGTKVASIRGQWAAEAWGPGEGQGAWSTEVGSCLYLSSSGHVLQFLKCFAWHGMDLRPRFLNDSFFSGLNYGFGKFFGKGLTCLD